MVPPIQSLSIPSRFEVAGRGYALSRNTRYQPLISHPSARLSTSPCRRLSQEPQGRFDRKDFSISPGKLRSNFEAKPSLPPEEIQRRQDFGIHSANIHLTERQLQQNADFAQYYEDPIRYTPIKDAWLGNDGRVYDRQTLQKLKGQSPFSRDMLVGVPDQFFVKAKRQYQALGYAPPLTRCGLSGRKTQMPVFSTQGHRCDRSTLQQSHLQELAEDLSMKPVHSASIGPSPRSLSQKALLKLLSEQAKSPQTSRPYAQQEMIALADRKINPDNPILHSNPAGLIIEDSLMDIRASTQDSLDRQNASLDRTTQNMKHMTQDLKDIGETYDRMIGDMRSINETYDRCIEMLKDTNQTISDYLAGSQERRMREGLQRRENFKKLGIKETEEFRRLYNLEPLPKKSYFPKFNIKNIKHSLSRIEIPQFFKAIVHQFKSPIWGGASRFPKGE